MNINLNFKNLCSSLRELLKEKVDKSDLDKTNDNVSAVENSIADISTKIDEKVGTEDLNTALENKVDKESGKGLSSNDYTADEKTKLSGIEEGANKYTLPAATSNALGGVKVDTALSTTSANPVQNKAVTAELNNIKAKTINGVALSSGQNLIVPRSSKSLLKTRGIVGSAGYIKFGTVTVTGMYADHPFYIRMHSRRQIFDVTFNLVATANVAAAVDRSIVNVHNRHSNTIPIKVFYNKTATTEIDFYYLKTQDYDNLLVEDFMYADDYEGRNAKFEFKSEFTATLPEGAVLIPTKADPDEIADSTACNLVDTSLISSTAVNGITRTNNNDGSITYTGTSTATTDVYVPLMASETLNAGTYTFNPHPSNTNETDYYYQIYKGGTYWKELDINSPISITSKNTYSIGIAIKPGASIDNNFYPMLEKGTVSHNWAGYTGGTGALNSDVAAIESRTKTTDWIDLLPYIEDSNKTDILSSSYLKCKRQGDVVNIVGDIRFTEEASNIGIKWFTIQNPKITQLVLPSYLPDSSYDFAIATTSQIGVYFLIQKMGSSSNPVLQFSIWLQGNSNVATTTKETPPIIGKGREYKFSTTYLV